MGTQKQKSVAPLVWRDQLRPAYNFLCLLYAKRSTRNKNGPHGVSRSLPVIHRNTLLGPLGGRGDVTTQYKNQVKSMARRPAIQEPKFSVCGIVFDGGCDGRGCGCHIFLALHARPSHRSWWAPENERKIIMSSRVLNTDFLSPTVRFKVCLLTWHTGTK